MVLDPVRPPMELIHMPSIHPGMYYLPPRPGWVLRPVSGANVRMFAASDSDPVLEMQQSAIDRQERRLISDVMEINSAPVVLRNAEFRNSVGSIGGRLLLNGASGDRIRHRFDVRNQRDEDDWRIERLTDAFRRARNRGGDYQPPVFKGDADALDIALELKNGFNYYHFTTETFGNLAHFADDETGRPINLHLPQDNIRGFVSRFIAAVFPAIAERVKFVTSAQKYPGVRSVYSHRHYLYQVQDARIHEAQSRSTEPRWQTLRSEMVYRRTVFTGSYDTSLRLLREHALRATPRAMVSGMPSLVWMGRDETGDARARGLTGHEPLIEELQARGFQSVIFEHLTPLEQIAAMQAADVVVAPHGAGLANLVYAKQGALVIEIGTRQTQLHRWGDFVPSAHVARCEYYTVFADIAGVHNPDDVPPMSDGHMGVHVGNRARARILQMVDRKLLHLKARAEVA